MAQIHVVTAGTTVEMSVPDAKALKQTECQDCTEVGKADVAQQADMQCAGEWTRCIAYINNPQHQNMLVIPSATSLADGVNKAARCGGDPTRVTYWSNPVLACAPYIRCNL